MTDLTVLKAALGNVRRVYNSKAQINAEHDKCLYDTINALRDLITRWEAYDGVIDKGIEADKARQPRHTPAMREPGMDEERVADEIERHIRTPDPIDRNDLIAAATAISAMQPTPRGEVERLDDLLRKYRTNPLNWSQAYLDGVLDGIIYAIDDLTASAKPKGE